MIDDQHEVMDEDEAVEERVVEKREAFISQVAALTPQLYDNLKEALELGRWPNGERLTDQQKSICMEAIILYDHRHFPEAERTHYIEKRGCKRDAASMDDQEASPLRWK